ncbi:MAG: DUF6273 domain-containing protein [Lachnoclostridium sp.]|nr:DUF6273 domain-containing protein [Lachnospira sp.]MCM1248496.1 DUF6273 domain-containing protein [Lachnoclostridium sp.]MCM1536127.1 DUF6273 domain-containing protein [Clostridium sp.]
MKSRKWFLIGISAIAIAITLSGILLAFCLYRAEQNLTLEKIAYDSSWRDYTVYIKENEEYVPYLVLTADYDGKVLLLREHLLPEEMQYKPSRYPSPEGSALSGGWPCDEYDSCYEKSSIDEYLNTDFLKRFSTDMQASIMDTTIEVTDKASLQMETWAEVTHMIKRKVFLLSTVELGIVDNVGFTAAKEGKPLQYFKNKLYSVKIARKVNGEAWPYWTRTPHLWETYQVTVIGVGGLGSATPDGRIGVRPVFCMEKDTAVKKSGEIIEGKSVYILELGGE